jgi:HEAT repeat protein
VLAPTSPLGSSSGPDLTLWSYWWQHNQAPFLNVKAHVRAVASRTSSDGWFLGQGQMDQALSLRPSVQQVRDQIVPALLAVLEKENDSSLLTGALVALGKIGPDGSTADAERFEAACVRLLKDPSQEVRETAALALGILGHGRAVPYLAHLLWDSESAQAWVGKREVGYRTRAFAAFGLAQVGARSESVSERESIVLVLRKALEADETKTPDVAAACVIALGLVPLPEEEGGADSAGSSGRAEQLEHLLAWFEDDEHHRIARAHCPTALARLAAGVQGPAALALRARVANDLVERLERGKEPAEVLQSCVQALGALATNGDGALDVRLRRALTLVDQRVSEPQARAFALMAMAEAGGRFGLGAPSGVGEARDFLVHELVFGKNALLPWSAMGCGVLAWHLRGDPGHSAALESLQRALRLTLADARTPERIGASALAAGLAGDQGSVKLLLKRLEDELPDDARGHVALALALLGEQGAVEPLRALVARSKYHPELLRSSAIALGILGDKDVVPQLATLLVEARSLASQAAIASAFGFIGDHRAVDPLLKLLTSQTATAKARAFAAVALGNVADKEDWPWNAKIALGLNYRAETGTLTDPISASGVLDIL